MTPLHIDFVSDVACPWCAVGLGSLLQALDQTPHAFRLSLAFRPFELSPDMSPEGEPVTPYLCAKYGISESQVQENHALITERGQAVGFEFDFREDSRKWNTFDAHRLLHWAATQSEQSALQLKLVLLKAQFTDNLDVSDQDVLVSVAESVGLDGSTAAALLEEGRYRDEVRAEQQRWQEMGIRSVPAMVINQQYLINGAQSPQALLDMLDRLHLESAE